LHFTAGRYNIGGSHKEKRAWEERVAKKIRARQKLEITLASTAVTQLSRRKKEKEESCRTLAHAKRKELQNHSKFLCVY
jgi:hypothetical protein